jgi:hypothetical protein
MLEKGKKGQLVVLNVLGLAVTLVMNTLASVLPLNGRDTGAISDSIPNLFVPAGLTFAIWGVIYTLLIVFAMYQVMTVRKDAGEADPVVRIGYWFFLSCIANSLWIVAWHWQFQLMSLILMLVILASLIAMHTQLRSYKGVKSTGYRFAVMLPISVYLGWITVATVANFTSVAVVLGWGRLGLSEEFWTVLVLVVAIVLNVLAVLLKGDIGFALVGIWALYGIYLKRSGSLPVVQSVVTVALVGMGLIALAVVYQMVAHSRKKPAKAA